LTRLFFTTDIHSSERCFKKIVTSVRHNVYKADIVFINGDLTGKAVIPIIQDKEGRFVARSKQVLGTDLLSKSYEEVHSNLRNIGCYPVAMTKEELEDVSADNTKIKTLFRNLMLDTLKNWLCTLELVSKQTRKTFFMMLGNDDIQEASELIDSSGIHNPENNIVEIANGYKMASLGYSNPTPWQTPRECSEEELYSRIETALRSLTLFDKAIFNFHCPPFDSGLDIAPVLDETLRPKVTMGDLVRRPVGSTAVRKSIEFYQPLLSMHGHIHESPGESRIGRTLCVNPGSEYQSGILRAYIIDLEDGKIKQNIRIEA
jgi:Icc-related predicted phosphoesterase